MEVNFGQSSIQSCSWMNSQTIKLRNSGGMIRFPLKIIENDGILTNFELKTNNNKKIIPGRCNQLCFKISSSLKKNSSGPVLKSNSSPAAVDESLVLKNKSAKIEPLLNGQCIYLVGMMGSGKTTIGRLLAEVLGYSFFDIDSLVETLEGISTAEIFKRHGECFFRDKETEVLQKVSMEHHLVVSTGGGAVIRPINWKHMRKGISVWLDVPIECLARRISAVGTDSRPLLHGEGDAYTKAYRRLSELFEERHDAYVNASAHVSLEGIATKLGHVDIDSLTPTVIAIEVLEQIEGFLKDGDTAL